MPLRFYQMTKLFKIARIVKKDFSQNIAEQRHQGISNTKNLIILVKSCIRCICKGIESSPYFEKLKN